MSEIHCDPLERVSQGDIFRNISFFEYYSEQNGVIELSEIEFPLVLVLTQDCDLHQEFKARTKILQGGQINQDKTLISVLVAPLYNEEFFFRGDHLSELDLKMRVFKGGSKTAINDIRENNNPRYHYLDFGLTGSIPPSVIDFKHYFSINLRYLESIKQEYRILRIKELYREDVSHRFSSFLSRIGLPEIDDVC